MTQWRVLCPHNHPLKTTTTTGDIREMSSPRVCNPRVGVSASCPLSSYRCFYVFHSSLLNESCSCNVVTWNHWNDPYTDRRQHKRQLLTRSSPRMRLYCPISSTQLSPLSPTQPRRGEANGSEEWRGKSEVDGGKSCRAGESEAPVLSARFAHHYSPAWRDGKNWIRLRFIRC